MATDDKYDRQTRLWGGHGQKKLAHSHVVMLGTSSYGSETLKNLVLPALGEFTIVDDAKVTERDFGNDFLVTRDDLGKNKAEVVKNMLVEMNPDVKGNHLDCSVQNWINKAEVKQYTMVIANDITQDQAVALSKMVDPHNICLVILRQYGMLGYLRVYKREQCIIEKKSQMDPYKRDLRMGNPWPELLEFANQFDFDNMAEVDHVHAPYVAILIQWANKWRATHDGKLPKTFPEKNEFRAMVKAANKFNGLNFEECGAVFGDVWQEEMPFHLPPQMEHPQVQEGRTEFWGYVNALKRFVDEEKRLPVSGVVPDMVAQTHHYLNMQQIYIKKAEQDREKLKKHNDAWRAEKKIETAFDPAEFLLFCKHIKQFCFMHQTSPEKEINEPNYGNLANEFWDPNSCVKWLLAMRCFESIRNKGSNPGEDEANQDEEYKLMREECDKITTEIEQEPVEEKYLREILRFGMAKLHNISAYMGGVAAQECIKMLIQQYTVVNHTFVFDGIHGRGQSFDY